MKMIRTFHLVVFEGISIITTFTCVNAGEWMKTYGPGTGRCVQQTANGGYIITGWKPISSDAFVCLIKTDSLGDTLWTRIFPDTVDTRGLYVQQTLDGGYIVAGEYNFTTGYLGGEGYLMKTDSLGAIQWEKTYGPASTFHCVEQTSDGGYISVGGKDGSIGISGWLLRINSDGDTLWTKTFTEMGPVMGDWVRIVNDGYAISGWEHKGGENYALWLAHVDSIGNTIWVQKYDTIGSCSEDRGSWGDQTKDGGYVLIGIKNILVRIDSIGNVMWMEKVCNYGPGPSVAATFDNGCVSLSYDSVHPFALYKYDSLGNLIWSKGLPSQNLQPPYYVAQTTDSGYIICRNWGNNISLTKIEKPTGVEEGGVRKFDFGIIGITPNPSISFAWVNYSINYKGWTELSLYDIAGRPIKVINEAEVSPGIHKVTLDTKDIPDGVYFCILKTGEGISTRKIVVLK